MKYANYIGVFAAIILIIACFLPWAYYPDIEKNFTGFFSEQGRYGRPGIAITVIALACLLLFIIPRIWAKRLNLILSAMALAFCARCYLLFTSCYRGYCPEKKLGIYLIVASSLIMLIASMLPQIKLKEELNAGGTNEQIKE